jgi:hypothetical protein
MRHHERELERLSASLGTLGLRGALPSEAAMEQARKSRQQEVFLNAQMIRHQISMALLASRLEAPLEA